MVGIRAVQYKINILEYLEIYYRESIQTLFEYREVLLWEF